MQSPPRAVSRAHLFVVLAVSWALYQGFHIHHLRKYTRVSLGKYDHFPILLMRNLKHKGLGSLPRVTELVVGFGFKPGLSDSRTQALRMIKYEIIKSNKSVKCKQDKLGMRWNPALYSRSDVTCHLVHRKYEHHRGQQVLGGTFLWE